ncbi:MAG TPA: hypothetical protein VN715_03310 [Roseiarcus sp.]|nr:hypothetical protein [Roseiarcus sp.]
MFRAPLAALALTLAASPAAAGQVSGPYALALAGVVAAHDPALSTADRTVAARLFAADASVSYPAGRSLVVAADKIVCRISDVQITARSCRLSFAAKVVDLTGAAANALFATLAAAGSIFEAVDHLSCKLTPSVILANGGGGADCAYAANP